MRTLTLLTALLVALGSQAVATESAKTTLSIDGMTCGGCAAAVKLHLKRTKGVTAYEVSYERKRAEVTYDPGVTTPRKIAESLARETGYKVTVLEESSVHADHPMAEHLASLTWIDDYARPPVEGRLAGYLRRPVAMNR